MLDHFKSIAHQYVKRDFSEGSIIFSQGETPEVACVLLSGVVRTLNISEHGEEQTINFHVEGEFFPSSWIFDKTTTCLYFYEAVTNAKAFFMPKKELFDGFESSDESRALLTDYLTSAYTTSQLRITALEQRKAQEKILLSFYYLCQKLGRTRPDGSVKIMLGLTHQAIASLVGVTRETASTELYKLKKKHILSYKDQEYIVNMSKLMQHMDENGFDNLPLKIQ